MLRSFGLRQLQYLSRIKYIDCIVAVPPAATEHRPPVFLVNGGARFVVTQVTILLDPHACCAV